MKYKIYLKPKAVKDLRQLEESDATRIVDALACLENNLAGDVKN